MMNATPKVDASTISTTCRPEAYCPRGVYPRSAAAAEPVATHESKSRDISFDISFDMDNSIGMHDETAHRREIRRALCRTVQEAQPSDSDPTGPTSSAIPMPPGLRRRARHGG